MADILVHRIEFIQDNPHGTYLSGDVIDVYIDDTAIVTNVFGETTGVSAFLNGVEIFSGDLIAISPSIILVQNYNVQICSTTYLVSFSLYSVWPYATYDTLADHYSCAVNPPTCDLLIVGSPSVTESSDEETADGSITITASSTNPIKYRLNYDFTYDDGNGQTSNVFSSLLPGNYRIFLRDSKNCSANLLVNVPFSNTYDVIYRLEYTDTTTTAGFGTKIDITKRGYSGAITEVKGGDPPFLLDLRGEGVRNKYEPILAISADITLMSEVNSAYIDLYTNDRNLYRVNYYKDFGSGYELMWVGKILPFIYMEPVAAPPYPSSFKASDGLPELKDNIFVQRDGQKFYGTVSLIKLVAYCLSFLKLDLNIRVAVNMYATGMNTTASDDPFDQAYIDYECFYLATQTPDADFVLRHILKAFKARITQWGNVWNIVRVDEMSTSYDYREFDYLGDYVSNSSSNPVKDLDYPTANSYMFENGANLELQPGYGEVNVTYKLGLRTNIIENGDFRLNSQYNPATNTYDQSINKQGFTLVNAGYSISEGYELLQNNGVAYSIVGAEDLRDIEGAGEAYLQTDQYLVKMGTNNQLKINVRYKVVPTSRGIPKYIKVRIRVKYGTLYLQSDGNWSSTEQILAFVVTSFNEYVESEIVATQPSEGTPLDGMNLEIRIYHAYQNYAQFHSTTDLEAFPTYIGGDQLIPTGYKTELREDFTFPSTLYYYELDENTETPTPANRIIRPDDYHATNNPRQWVPDGALSVNTSYGKFCIDRLRVSFLTNNEPTIDAVIRTSSAEPQNSEVYEDELIIGSYSELVVTEIIDRINNRGQKTPITITTAILSADLIYTGWLRDSTGEGYEFWTRDGVAESDKLNGIWLKSHAYQYSKTWRLLRGAIVSKTGFFSPIDSIRDVNDSNRIYIPISLSINDKNNMAAGEFLELRTDIEGTGEGGGSEFSSAFSTAFGNNFD